MMVLELTTTGWKAVWDWVQERTHEPEVQDEFHWYKHALRSINLVHPGEDLVVCMRGALSKSGYLEALRMRPDWYRPISRPTGSLTPLY